MQRFTLGAFISTINATSYTFIYSFVRSVIRSCVQLLISSSIRVKMKMSGRKGAIPATFRSPVDVQYRYTRPHGFTVGYL